MSRDCNSIESTIADERFLAGAAMLGGDTLDAICDAVSLGDFADHTARLVVQTAIALAEQNLAPDAAKVFSELRRTGKAAELGESPAEVLAELVTGVGAGSGVEYHAARVHNAAGVRQVCAIATDLLNRARNTTEPLESLIADAEAKLFELATAGDEADGGPTDLRRLVSDSLRRVDERRENPDSEFAGHRTGFPHLDSLLGGGFKSGELVIVAARPSVGKTSMLAGFATSAAQANIRSLIFSLEMASGEIGDRVLSVLSGVPLDRIVGVDRLTDDETQRLMAVETMRRGMVWVDDRTGRTVNQIASVTRRAVRKHNVGMILIDYVQEIEPDDGRQPRHEQLGRIAKQLKRLARTTGIPVIAAAQLNRQVEGRSDDTPRCSDLRESGSLEQAADVILLLHPKPFEEHEALQDVDVIVGKNRNGKRGTVPLKYRRCCTRFENPPARR